MLVAANGSMRSGVNASLMQVSLVATEALERMDIKHRHAAYL